ncbi:MAG: autotransporter domain-containing protein [Akkermansia sp.]
MRLESGGGIVEGNLTLNVGSGSLPYDAYENYLEFDVRQNGSIIEVPHLTVTGTLNVAGKTAVSFFNAMETEEGWGEGFLKPDASVAIMTVGDVQGDLHQLVAYSAYWESEWRDNDDYSYEGFHAELLSDSKFVSRVNPNGGYDIFLVDLSVPDVEPDNTPIVSDGAVTELGKDKNYVDFGSGNGTVDATAVSDGLNTQNVRGQSGTLVTSDTQTMDLLGNSTLGYSIAGTSDDVAGAALLMRGNAVELRGASYHVANVTVNTGTLDVSSQTELEVADGGKIQLNSALNNYGTIQGNVELSAANAALDNRGEIAGNVELNSAGSVFANNGTLTGDLTVAEGASVRGNGTFIGSSRLTNATMHIGNSPGRMTYTGNTVLDGSTLEFTLDGLRASQGATDTLGTYSTVVFNGGDLTITNGLTLKLDASDAFLMELLDAQPDSVTLTLMDVSGATNAGDAALTAALAGAEIQFTGVDAAILENVTLDGSGTLTATVNQALLAALMTDNGAELADTMQSSARLLEDFSEMSTQQLSIVSAGETHAWLSGLGSFEDMGGAHGFRYHGGGAVVGVAHGFTDSLSVGVSLGYAEGTFKADSDRVRDEQETTMFSLHGQYVRIREHSARWLTGYVAYGFTENDATTRVAGSTASPSWEDQALRVGAQYGVEVPLASAVTLKSFIGVDYTRVEQEAFSERSAAVTTRYEDGRMQTLSVTPGVSLRQCIGLGGTCYLLPELTLAYVGDLVRDEPTVRRRVMGMSDKRRGSNPGRHAFSLRAGGFLIVDECTSFNAFYALETRSDETAQSVNAGVHVAF